MPGRSLANWRDAAARRLRGRTQGAPSPPLPEIVEVRTPGGAPFRMHTRGGADQIARDLAKSGWHAFERPLPDVFAALVRAGQGLVVDVGANTGFYSLVAAGASPAAAVHAFEPFPPVLRCLEANLALNPELAARICVFPRAVSDEMGRSVLYVPDPGHGLVETSCSLNRDFKERVVDEVAVDVVTLDSHVESVGEPAISVLKIDVESLEHRVLAGAERVLARDRPVVLLEVLPSGEPEEIDALRRRQGYTAVRLRRDVAIAGGPVQFDPEGWNQALVPTEKLDQVKDVLARVPLPVTVVEGEE